MKAKVILILALALLVAMPTLAMADDDRTITVTGKATLTVSADTAVIALSVETVKTTVSEATQENAATMEKVLQALRDLGLQDKDIITENYYVMTMYDYEGATPSIRGYSVTNSLSVTVRDLKMVGQVIDTAFAAGVNSCGGVSFRASNANEYNDEVLKAAIAEGRRKAALVAEASGVSLGKVLSVTEAFGTYTGAAYTQNTRSAKADEAVMAATAIMADGLDLSATVTIVFEIAH